MKKTIKLFAILAVLLFAASCQNKGLDGGQTLRPELSITATIAQPDASRVTYDVDNETTHTITPAWTVGDEIIGFDDADQTFTFTVDAVDGSGRAVLDLGGYTQGTATKLYAIYAPGKAESDLVGTGEATTLAVNLGTQNAVLDDDSPVLMCATAEITAGSATLAFENQTAIIGLTRFKLPVAATVTSIAVDGLVTTGTFSVEAGALVLTPGTTPATVSATGSWATGDGNICETALYFATLPTTAAKIALRANDGANDYGNLASIAATDIEAGNYYYMQKNLGVPVADVNGVKYGTIDDAFAAANRATSDVTITLLANCASSGVLRLNTSAGGTGDVTLDLGTYTLTGYTSGSTINTTDRNLTITGTTGKITSAATSYYVLYVDGTGSAVISGGTILSSAYRAVLCNTATASITVTGGTVSAPAGQALRTHGSLEITGGTVSSESGYAVSALKTASLTISGGTLSSESSYVVYTLADATISGGTFSSNTNNIRLGNENDPDQNVTISGGSFTSGGSNSAVYANAGTLTITEGRFCAGSVNPVGVGSGAKSVSVTGGCFNKPLKENVLGGSYINVHNTDAGTRDTYPFTVSPIASTPKVATLTQSTHSWDFGTIEGAMKGADVRANAAGNSTVTLTDDCSATSTMSVSAGNTYSVTLDLAGYDITSTASGSAISTASTFTLNDSGATSGEINSTATALAVTAGAATVNSGSLYGATNAASVSSGASLTIADGYFYGNGAADIIGAGTTTVYGGFFRYNPASMCAASAASSDVTENFGGRTYNYQVEAVVVATVNGVGYPTLAAAAEAAVAYDGASETVTLQLQDDVTYNATLNLTHASKPVTLDLNGHVLSTTVNSFIYPTTGTLTVTDSQNKVGKITSSSYQVLYIGGSAHFTLSNCVIECTQEAASGWSSQTAVMLGGATMQTTISNSWIYTTGYTSTIRMNNSGCRVTIEGSEISSGVGAEKGFYAIINNQGTLTISTTSVWTKSSTTEGNAPSAIHHSNAATTTIDSGYFWAGQDRTISGNYGTITLNGGYYDKAPTSTKAECGTGKSLLDCTETHTHATTGTELTYTKYVTTTP